MGLARIVRWFSMGLARSICHCAACAPAPLTSTLTFTARANPPTTSNAPVWVTTTAPGTSTLPVTTTTTGGLPLMPPVMRGCAP